MRQILTDCLISAPAWLTGWGRDAETATILAGLLQLRDCVVTQALTISPALTTGLTPFDFTQHSPFFGRIRATIHALAGKWAFHHLRQEQNAINRALAQALAQQRAANIANANEISQLLQHLHKENN